MPASWLSRLSIGKKLALSFSVILFLLIGSLSISFFYLSRVNSYVERHKRITIPAVVTASEMLRNLSDMQTHMHHLLDHQNNAEQTISLKDIADIERRTLTTLDTYQAAHAVHTHPVLYGMLQQHGQSALADQESQTIVAIADGISALRAHREDLEVAIRKELVHQRRFRDDLLYRINTVTLRVPPIHERKEDLPKLAEHILSTLRIPGTTKRTLSLEAVQALTTHSWPGNVRELRNVLEGIVLMSNRTGPIGPDDVLALLPKTRSSSQTGDQTHLSLEEIERLHIERVLTASDGNKTQAAKTLDIDYKTLLTKLKKYRLAT
jgi:hypothetical protein